MLFSCDIELPPNLENVDQSPVSKTEMVKAYTEIDSQLYKSFKLDQKTFMLEKGIFLRFRERITCKLTNHSFKIGQLNQDFPRHDLIGFDFDATICRAFLELYGKAQNNTLTDEEKKSWLFFVDSIDYTRFSLEMSRPFYCEGTIVKKYKNSNIIKIEWNDGEIEQVKLSLNKSLSYLEENESFSAYVKRNRFDQTSLIESLIPIDDTNSSIDMNDVPVIELPVYRELS